MIRSVGGGGGTGAKLSGGGWRWWIATPGASVLVFQEQSSDAFKEQVEVQYWMVADHQVTGGDGSELVHWWY